MQDNFDSHIGRSTLFWLLLTNLAILSPLFDKIMPWSIGICAICFLWRVGIYFGRVAAPPKLLVTSLAIGAATTLALVASQIGALNALVNLLLLGYALKYIEMRQVRDVKVLVLVGYFLIGFSLLEYNSILNTLHLLLVSTINTCVLISLYQEQSQPAMESLPKGRDNVRMTRSKSSLLNLSQFKFSLKLLAQSLPLALILFVVFPRLPPLWLMPSMDNARTGLSNEMAFGDISKLTRSAELAFRVGFDSKSQGRLANQDLYWRTLVLDEYDGETWRQHPSMQAIQTLVRQVKPTQPTPDLQGQNNKSIAYNIISEPSYQKWLYGLDVATSDDPKLTMLPDHRLYALNDITQRFSYAVVSYPNAVMDRELSKTIASISLQLPKGLNPQTLALAAQFKRNYPEPKDRLAAMMGYFNRQAFFYTLSPPSLGKQQVDDFLFNNKAGFCAHYASALVYMARATGLPARVVTGYQGGEYNPEAGYYSVYQYMAHAWAEVWLEGQGWQRFDPTAMIAPERILDGFDASFDGASSYLSDTLFTSLRFKHTPWLNELRYKLASLDYYWSLWVLGFDETKKQQVLDKLFGDISLSQLAMIILGLSSIILLLIAYSAGLLHFSFEDKLNRRYLSICQRLINKGLVETKAQVNSQAPLAPIAPMAPITPMTPITPMAPPQRFAAEIAPKLIQFSPKLAKQFAGFSELYIALKYQDLPPKQHRLKQKRFHALYRKLRFGLLVN